MLKGIPTKANRTLVCGVGINDIMETTKIEGVSRKHYSTWLAMMHRCYSDKVHKNSASYSGCSVDTRWHKLSDFVKWFDVNYVEGWDLDKDLKVKGNKVYGPDTCTFLPQEVNCLLLIKQRKGKCSKLPAGVVKTRGKRFRSFCSADKIQVFLGYFDTPEEAHRAWQEAKIKRCNQLIERYSAYPKVVLGLQRVLKDLTFDFENKLITESL